MSVAGELLITGEINITHTGRELAAGDQVVLWQVGSVALTQQAVIHLPELPDGLYWDTSDLLRSEGRLRVTNDSSVGISNLDADQSGHLRIYNLNGVRVNQPQVGGIYIVNGKKVYFKK